MSKGTEKNFYKKLDEQIEILPYEKHVDDGQYNDGQRLGFEIGAKWAYDLLSDKLLSKGLLLSEIENLMTRSHLGRDEDSETIEGINDLMYKNGYLQFFNNKSNEYKHEIKRTCEEIKRMDK